jgi:hypothetical protein
VRVWVKFLGCSALGRLCTRRDQPPGVSTCANYGLRCASARVPLANERQMKHEERLVSLEKEACLVHACVCFKIMICLACSRNPGGPPGAELAAPWLLRMFRGTGPKSLSSLLCLESIPQLLFLPFLSANLDQEIRIHSGNRYSYPPTLFLQEG